MHSRPIRNISLQHQSGADALRVSVITTKSKLSLRKFVRPWSVCSTTFNAGLDATRDHLVIDLETVSVDAFRTTQIREQFTVAAAEVEHACVRGDEIGDDRYVGSHRAFTRSATCCRYARSTLK